MELRDRGQEDSDGLVPSEEKDSFANRHRKGVVVEQKPGLQEGSVYPLLSLRRHGPDEWT